MKTLQTILCMICVYARAAERYTIVSNYPAAQALNLTITGDGWTAGERTTFLGYATNLANALTNQPDIWLGYCDRINVFAAFTNSTTSGVASSAGVGTSPYKGYVSGSVARIDPTPMLTVLGEVGLGGYKVFCILNDGAFAGTTTSSRSCITTNASWISIAKHEQGHLIANLEDEYNNGQDGVYALNNATTYAEATNRWLTAYPSLYPPKIISGTLIYRPTDTCRLINNSDPWCLVCSNHMTTSFFTAAGITQNPTVSYRPNLNTGKLNIR